MKTINTINPTSEEICGIYTFLSEEEARSCIEESSKVQKTWAKVEFKARKQRMLALAKLLLEEKQQLASLISNEMGKPIQQAYAEIEKSAVLCAFYAKNAERFLKPELIKTPFYKSYCSYHPLGLIFAIMPWNFPLWQVMRFAVPNVMAGNACLLKHAPNCFGVSFFIEELFLKAGFPNGLFCSLVIDIDLVPLIIHHPAVAGVTLTGSNRAGRVVAKEAGEALKKLVLELGGSDPYIILKDASLEFAAEQCVRSRLNNCGQVCIAAKRLIVVEDIADEFERLVIEKAKKYTYGNPMDKDTLMGPLARKDLRDNLHAQVQKAIQQGARCVLGGKIPEEVGFFYPATVLLDVKADSVVFAEELFGPVIAVIRAEDEDHALWLANKTDYGLAGSIFTEDLEKGEYLANQILAAGTCGVNTLITTHPNLPFGGIKQSGYGRELSVEGIREFMNIKTVVISKP